MGEWGREYKSLKQKISTLDKDVFKLLTFTKTTTMKNDIQNLIDFEEKKEFERHVETEDLYTFIVSLKKDIFNLKEHLKTYTRTPASLGKIQELTEKIEEKLSKFKERQMVNFDRILEEEANLSHEIDLITQKLDTYETVGDVSDIPIPTSTKGRPFRAASLKQRTTEVNVQSVDREDDDYEENNVIGSGNVKPMRAGGSAKDLAKKFKEQIERINSEIDKLGGASNLGWENEDHQMFLKIRTKHRNNVDKISFLNDCITSLPFYGEDDIRDHIEKFKKYSELEDEKKKITKEYKENKENEKKNMIESIRQEDLKKEEQAKVRQANMAKLREEKEKEREKLKEWRATKIARQAVEIEKVKDIEIMKRKEKEEKEKARREAERIRILEFKEKKEMEKIREKEREEYKKAIQKRQLDKEELQRIKEKEENLLKKNFEQIALKKKKEQEKTLKMQQIMEAHKNAYAYVEPKLTEETKAAETRKRQKYDPKKDGVRYADTFGGAMVKPLTRAVPSWRQGLS